MHKGLEVNEYLVKIKARPTRRRTLTLPIYKIFFHLSLVFVVCARINHPLMTPAPFALPTLLQYICAIPVWDIGLPPTLPVDGGHRPYNIGDDNIVYRQAINLDSRVGLLHDNVMTNIVWCA